MKIVSIFDEVLFSFHYEGEAYNEYKRLLDLWRTVEYLNSFAKKYGIADVQLFINDILQNVEQVQDFLENSFQNRIPYESYFEPLQSTEHLKLLSFQKGKIKKNQLRLYAIKLDNNCFVITGGAIKMSQAMQDHPDTEKELSKLNAARLFLKEKGVFDEDSFFELLIDQQ